MKVKCRLARPTIEQVNSLSISLSRDYHVTVGKEYVVLALSFLPKSRGLGSGVQLQLISDYGRVIFCPLVMLEIVDDRSSRHWIAQLDEDGEFHLQPQEFYREYFHDDLSEGVAEVVEAFKRTVDMLNAE